MTQKEALQFLELPETATNNEIRIRLAEKLEYFEHLSEEAPSDFLRRINARHADKVKHIQQEFFSWAGEESGSEVFLPSEPQEEGPVEEEVFTTPIIVSSGSSLPPVIPEMPQPVGWLIRHTENQSAQTWPLFTGKNYLGRKAPSGLSQFAIIEDDPYISRVHAVVYVEEGTPAACYIVDAAEMNNGKPSANGTFVNGNKTRVVKKEKLKDADTIQVGVTKLVFKYNVKDIKGLVSEVAQSSYMNTVAIEN
jgi:hypothetical protein